MIRGGIRPPCFADYNNKSRVPKDCLPLSHNDAKELQHPNQNLMKAMPNQFIGSLQKVNTVTSPP
jgi:hypothetical protein